MQIVATIKPLGTFFRAQSFTKNNLDKVKESMISDAGGAELEFTSMTDVEFDEWLKTH